VPPIIAVDELANSLGVCSKTMRTNIGRASPMFMRAYGCRLKDIPAGIRHVSLNFDELNAA
jgi:hypothetical protein